LFTALLFGIDKQNTFCEFQPIFFLHLCSSIKQNDSADDFRKILGVAPRTFSATHIWHLSLFLNSSKLLVKALLQWELGRERLSIAILRAKQFWRTICPHAKHMKSRCGIRVHFQTWCAWNLKMLEGLGSRCSVRNKGWTKTNAQQQRPWRSFGPLTNVFTAAFYPHGSKASHWNNYW